VLDLHGYDTVVCNVDSPAQRDHHLAALTARHRAAGVIIVSLPLSRRQLAEFRAAAIPLVAVDVSLPGVPHMIIDDVAGGELATTHLMSLGHRRIGFVGDKLPAKKSASLGFRASARRLAGYQRALTAAGLPGEAQLVRVGPHGPASAEALAADLLGLPDPPSAIFAASDTQAMGVLSAAERLGIAIPGQLSVVGFDDIQAAELLGLSTVRQPLEDSGAMGAERLCAIMRGDEIRPLRELLPVQMVQRRSSAKVGHRAGSGAAEHADKLTHTIALRFVPRV
jgi:DNA-binding LacI/PurR family transcriptional regulator